MNSSLWEMWEQRVRESPDALASRDIASGALISRGRLFQAARDWAARQKEFDLAGRPVVFSEPNGITWLEIFLGIQARGGVAVALDPSEPATAQQAVADSLAGGFLWQGGRLVESGRGRRRARGVCLLKMTSGSTGVPKPLAFTAAQMEADGRQICTTMGISRADTNLGCIPWGHSYGLGNLVLPLLLHGIPIVAGVSPLPHALAAAARESGATVFPAVPALLRGLTEADIDPALLTSLRTVISAGAPLRAETAQAFFRKFGIKVHNFYGSSETGGIAYDRSGECALDGRAVGRPMDGVRLEFGARGRFQVISAAVMGRGVFRVSDRGELNADGELVLLGRSGRMIKLAGRRIDPAEIERVLKEMPGVRDARVQVNPARADALIAFVASENTPARLDAWLRGRMAGWKVPRRLILMKDFPLTARGKVDTRALNEIVARR